MSFCEYGSAAHAGGEVFIILEVSCDFLCEGGRQGYVFVGMDRFGGGRVGEASRIPHLPTFCSIVPTLNQPTNASPADPSDQSQLRRPRTSPPRTGNSQRRTATGRGEGGPRDCGSEGTGGDAGRKGDGGEGWEGGGEVRG